AKPPRIVVAGSLLLDLVVRTPRRPARGETVFGTVFGMFLGGKGFNQAVAAGRLGAVVAMIGRVGDDQFGRDLRDALVREGIDTTGLTVDPDTGTGVAIPIIDPSGDNSIISVPRANMRLTSADVGRAGATFAPAEAVLLQMEVPVEASLAAARAGQRCGARILLNTAPAGDVPRALLEAADVLIANESEAETLTGLTVATVAEAFAAAEHLRVRSTQVAVITLGPLGAVAVGPALRHHAPAHAVVVQDTTGAGDAFCAALAVGLTETEDVITALGWANAAGACAVTVLGAEPSLPRRQAVLDLIVEKSETERNANTD
ncbi:MAG: ribokinase, partial [Dehalococcoidia bacterium]